MFKNLNENSFFMQLAISKAWEFQGLTYPNPAVGAVIVKNKAILSIEAHQKAGSSHGEVLALLSAYEKIKNIKLNFNKQDSFKAHNFLNSLEKDFFKECSLFVTLEPCSHIGKTPSCATLLSKLNLKEVFIATKELIKTHSQGASLIKNSFIGLLEKEALELLEPFKIWQKRAFVLFKMAQTTNAKIGGGYLSSKESLEDVHKIRAICDFLLIGGNTVRVDRPTLDCRFIEANSPNIKIFTQKKEFDKTIPLFNIKNREVQLTSSLDFLENPSFVLVEGGEAMLQSLAKKIDFILIYQTPKLSSNNLTYNINLDLQFLHYEKMGKDLKIWSKI